MATMNIIDKSTGKTVVIKIDQEDIDKFSHYKYFLDRNSDKPFREEKVDNKVKRIFLARDIMGFKLGDKRVVNYNNGDIHDLRKENLIEGLVGVRHIPKDNFWPFTFKSLLNFLEKREGDDEDLSLEFLAKTVDVKYSRKRIDLTYEPSTYDEFQKKKVLLAIKRVLNKHFEWGGQVVVVKDLKYSPPPAPPPPLAPPLPVITVVDKEPKIAKEFEDKFKYRHIKDDLLSIIASDRNASIEFLSDSRIFPIEDLVKALHERMPNMVIQFTSK